MKQCIWLFFIATFWMVSGVTAAVAQEEPTMVRVSTFGRQASILAERQSKRWMVLEAGEQIQPDVTAVESIEQIIVAVDTSDSMKYILPNLVDLLQKSLPVQSAAPIMIATFSDRVEKLSDFTTSRQILKEALSKVRPSRRATKLFEAVQVLQRFAAGRRTHLLLITDGADTVQQKVNIQQILTTANTTISYLSWGYGDPSLPVDEPGYQPSGKSHLIKIEPDSMLASLAETSGGDVMNFTDWKLFSRYLQQRLSSGGFLYRLFWHTENPERSFQIIDAEQRLLIAMRRL